MTREAKRERTTSYEEKGTWIYLAVAIAGYSFYLSRILPEFLAGTPVDEIDRALVRWIDSEIYGAPPRRAVQ